MKTADKNNQFPTEQNAVSVETPTIITTDDPTANLTIDQFAEISLVQDNTSFTVRLKANEIKKVDFYLQNVIVGSPQIYIGNGSLNSVSGFWELTFDSSIYPNGDYDLSAAITGTSGSFRSNKFRFTISNTPPVDINQQNVRVEQLTQAQQIVSSKTDEIKTIVTAAQNSAAVVSPSSVTRLQNQIQQFSGTVEKIKQLQNVLSQVEIQKSDIEADINRVKQKIAALPPETSSVILNDFAAEIQHLINQKRPLIIYQQVCKSK